MFSDTITLTVNAVAKNLVRINQDSYSSEYQLKNATECYGLKIRNSKFLDKSRGENRDRHNVEIVHTIYPVAPATQSVVRKYYFVLENGEFDSTVDTTNFALGSAGFQTSANIGKLLNWES
jgi:hypothetical protein